MAVKPNLHLEWIKSIINLKICIIRGQLGIRALVNVLVTYLETNFLPL